MGTDPHHRHHAHTHTTRRHEPRSAPASTRAGTWALLALPVLVQAQNAPASPTRGIELSRRVEIVDGKELILIRARPPEKSAAPVPTAIPAPVSAPQSSVAERLEALRLAAKKHESFTVTATVYAGPPALTELRWRAAGRDWLAFSNVDFHALTQLSQIETADTVYLWFPFVSDGDADRCPRPPGLVFSSPEAEYVVYASQAEWEAAPEAFAALDRALSLYEERRVEFDTALALRRAEEARRAAEPTPPPKPHVVRYYVAEPASSARQEGGVK